MKLLILTQKIDENDDVLGFFVSWLSELAFRVESAIAICLEKGEFDAPEKVKVLSLGKEDGRSRIKYLFRFFRFIRRERKNYDAVFIHMNAEYAVLGGIFWRLWGKKTGLWYAHGHVPLTLKIAEKLVDIIFTSTKSGCRIESKKVRVIGQGIDTEKFHPGKKEASPVLRIITVGRISPVKDYETLIRAAEILARKGIDFSVKIVGGPGRSDQIEYEKKLKELASVAGLEKHIVFTGPIANKKIVQSLVASDIFVNMSRTGSLDKAILEAMAVGLPVLTSNEASKEILGRYRDELMYPAGGFESLADKIGRLDKMGAEARTALGANLRKIVERNHSVSSLAEKILAAYEK